MPCSQHSEVHASYIHVGRQEEQALFVLLPGMMGNNKIAPEVREDPELEASTPGSAPPIATTELLLGAAETGDLGILEAALKKLALSTVMEVRDSQTWPLLAIAGVWHLARRQLHRAHAAGLGGVVRYVPGRD